LSIADNVSGCSEPSTLRLGRGAEKVRSVFEPGALRASQPKVCFMNQRRWLQRVPGTLGSHFPHRDGAQFGINLRVKLI
jgi:hypothetical protein